MSVLLASVGQDAINDLLDVGINSHGFSDKIGSIPSQKVSVIVREMVQMTLYGCFGSFSNQRTFFGEYLYHCSGCANKHFFVQISLFYTEISVVKTNI